MATGEGGEIRRAVDGGVVELLVPGRCSPMVRESLSAEHAGRLAGVFKALGDPVRLRLLSLIASHQDGEACVCDLTREFGVSQPTISHHLKVLREAGLLSSKRRATWVYYRAQPEALAVLSQLLDAGIATRTETTRAPVTGAAREQDPAEQDSA